MNKIIRSIESEAQRWWRACYNFDATQLLANNVARVYQLKSPINQPNAL